MEALLQARNLTCERDDRTLFRNLEFAVRRGEIWRIEGPNGAGKTTLLRILSGLGSGFEGSVLWQGTPIAQVRMEYQTGLLYIGHTPGVKAVLTPEENLRWYMALHHQVDTAAIDRALAQVGLYGFEDVPCYTLSAGQQRRVALARLYLSPAPLWILDEPFTAIDKEGVAAIERLVAEHAARGGAVILTTHHELKVPVELKRLALGHRGDAGE